MHTHTHDEHMCIQHTGARVSKPRHTGTHTEKCSFGAPKRSQTKTFLLAISMILVTRQCDVFCLFFCNNFLPPSEILCLQISEEAGT